MKNWTIGKRIFALSALLLTLLITLSSVSFVAFKKVENLARNRLQNDTIPGINFASDIGTYTLNAHVEMLTIANEPDATQREAHLAQLKFFATKVSKAMVGYEAIISSAEDRANFDQLKAARAAYLKAREEFLALVTADKIEEASLFLATKIPPLFKPTGRRPTKS